MRGLMGSLALFVVAGLCEIGGGWLMWQWWRHGTSLAVGLLGAVLLVTYGIIPTYQPAHFARVYAAYGAIFIVLSLLWGWAIDRIPPDRFDLLGATLCLAGALLIMHAPR